MGLVALVVVVALLQLLAVQWRMKLPGVSLRGVEVRGVWDAEPA